MKLVQEIDIVLLDVILNAIAATSLLGTKRTCWCRLTMSAPEGKTDVPRGPGHFRF